MEVRPRLTHMPVCTHPPFFSFFNPSEHVSKPKQTKMNRSSTAFPKCQELRSWSRGLEPPPPPSIGTNPTPAVGQLRDASEGMMVLCRLDVRRRRKRKKERGRLCRLWEERKRWRRQMGCPSHGGTGGSAGLVQPQRSAQPAREIHLLHLGALDEGVTLEAKGTGLGMAPAAWPRTQPCAVGESPGRGEDPGAMTQAGKGDLEELFVPCWDFNPCWPQSQHAAWEWGIPTGEQSADGPCLLGTGRTRCCSSPQSQLPLDGKCCFPKGRR